MITTLIICVTIIVGLFLILKWAHDMSTANLPMFTYGEYVKVEETETLPAAQPIGFVTSEEEKQPEEQTKKEIKEAYLKDPITLTASLLRGEVDIDDITT